MERDARKLGKETLTIEETISSLEACSFWEKPDCEKCKEVGPGFGFACREDLRIHVLALLKAQMQEISRLKNHVDCDAAETTPNGCMGYGRGPNDDEPCETCKSCAAYVGYGEE